MNSQTEYQANENERKKILIYDFPSIFYMGRGALFSDK
jgi:hypothetical protein